jgi:hypothetical protein
MSLMKRRTMTEKQKAAARANGARSHGPTTGAGREHIRAVHLRHGLYSQAGDVVLTSLGENLEQFEELRQRLYDSWPGGDPSEIENLAAAMWRLQRIEFQQIALEIRLEAALLSGGWGPEHAPDWAAFEAGMRLEESASNEMLRIGNRLLEAPTANRQRFSPTIREKVAGIEIIENKHK